MRTGSRTFALPSLPPVMRLPIRPTTPISGCGGATSASACLTPLLEPMRCMERLEIPALASRSRIVACKAGDRTNASPEALKQTKNATKANAKLVFSIMSRRGCDGREEDAVLPLAGLSFYGVSAALYVGLCLHVSVQHPTVPSYQSATNTLRIRLSPPSAHTIIRTNSSKQASGSEIGGRTGT
eukprot:976431-Rhodomonas_salina.2